MLLGCSGGLVAAKFVKCPKSYYTEQFEKYGYIRDKYDTTYNTPTPYDLSLFFILCNSFNLAIPLLPTFFKCMHLHQSQCFIGG